MKNQWPLGLVVEGNATGSAVLRLPHLADQLGPIKARALRVARRLSNFLRAGYAVNTYEELQATRMLFLRVPDAELPRTIEEICSSELPLRDVSVVLCESFLGTNVLKPLQMRGAFIATLTPIQAVYHNWFIVEGQLPAVRQTRRFLDRNDARTVELRSGSKPLYFAAALLAASLPFELYAAAQQALRSAGLSGNPLHELLDSMSVDMFRAFSRGVKLSWPAGRTGCPPVLAESYLNELRAKHPEIARVIDAHLPRLAAARNRRNNGTGTAYS